MVGKDQQCNPIHDATHPVYSDLPYATDAAGGNASSYVGTYPLLSTSPWLSSTKEVSDLTSFRSRWNLYDPFAQMADYRRTAETQGNLYMKSTSGDVNVTAPDEANAVIYIEYTGPAGTYNFKHDNFATERPGGVCQPGKSLILVVDNGNVNVQGNTDINAVVIVRGGDYNNNGNAYVYGGIFTTGKLSLGSAGGLAVDDCAKDNAPPGETSTASPTLGRYVEYVG